MRWETRSVTMQFILCIQVLLILENCFIFLKGKELDSVGSPYPNKMKISLLSWQDF